MQRYREAFRLGTRVFVGVIGIVGVVGITGTMGTVGAVVPLGAQTPAASTPAPAPAPAKAKAAKPAMAHHADEAGAIKWGPTPPSLPPGASMAVLAGDPAKAGELFILRLKGPDGYRVPPHTHPGDEHLTVLKGNFRVGMGEKWDDKAMKSLSPNGYMVTPKNTAHYAALHGETIVEVVGIGPFAMKYVNPDDDPSMKKTAGSK
jgi:quercetin dioxygenase-like cupin family protein